MTVNNSKSEKPDRSPNQISNGTNGAVNGTEAANRWSDLGAVFDFRSTMHPNRASHVSPSI